MSKVLIDDSILNDIANAIHERYDPNNSYNKQHNITNSFPIPSQLMLGEMVRYVYMMGMEYEPESKLQDIVITENVVNKTPDSEYDGFGKITIY